MVRKFSRIAKNEETWQEKGKLRLRIPTENYIASRVVGDTDGHDL